mgnify:CR=1 FL=1
MSYIAKKFHKLIEKETLISNEKNKVIQKEKEIDDWYIRQRGER